MTRYYCPGCHRYVITETYIRGLNSDEVCPHCENAYISDFLTPKQYKLESDDMSELKCNECGKSNYTKQGFNINKTGKHQRYLCKDCGHVFTEGVSND